MPDQDGPTHHVVFRSPGPKWVEGTVYNEQPEFWDHVKYMGECHAKGKIVPSGPSMEGPGVMAAGGMTLFRAADLKGATAFGPDDPTVRAGMLKFEIKLWWVPFLERPAPARGRLQDTEPRGRQRICSSEQASSEASLPNPT